MTDYVIAIRHGERLTYYRDQWGRYWSNEEGLKRAERYPSLEAARRVVQCQFPGHRKRMAVIPLSSEMLGRGNCPPTNAVPPCGGAHG